MTGARLSPHSYPNAVIVRGQPGQKKDFPAELVLCLLANFGMRSWYLFRFLNYRQESREKECRI